MDLWGEEIDAMPPTPRQLGRHYADAWEEPEPRHTRLRGIVIAAVAAWCGFIGMGAILWGIWKTFGG